MLWDERSAVQRASQTPATGLPVEMGMEALTAGFNFTQDEEKSTSLERALWEEYDTYLDSVEQATGARLPNPIGFAPRDYEDRPAGMTGQLGNQVRLRRQQEEIGQPVTGMPGFEEQLKKARDLNPANFPEPPTAGQLLDRITTKLGMSREKYEDMQSRMTAGGTVAGIVGSMGAIATDPMVAATLPFGAGAGRALVTKMLIEAGIAGASELAVQPYIMRGKEAIESPYSAGDAAINVLAAAGLGAAFPAAGALLSKGGSAATRVLGRAFHPERPLVRPATPTERAAVADVEREMMAEESSPTTPDDLPAYLEALDDVTAFVRETGEPPTRQTATRVVINGEERPDAANQILDEIARVPVAERIQSSAVAVKGEVFTGDSHAEALEKAVAKFGQNNVQMSLSEDLAELQGFVTSSGRWVDRSEAAKIAAASDQIDTIPGMTPEQSRNLVLGTDELFAEQLKGAKPDEAFARFADEGIKAAAREDPDLARALDTVESIRAYHGSPHRFERFSMEKIGTGEGAQAYGRGLYFAEGEQVARSYQKNLTQTAAAPALEWEQRNPDVAKQAREQLSSFAEANRITPPDDQTFALMLNSAAEGNPPDVFSKELSDQIAKTWAKPEGSLYTVDLAVSREDLLDWDKPLSQQSEKVRKRLEGAGILDDARLALGREDIESSTGAEIYNSLGKESEGELSRLLNAAGIPGIRYLDAGSRAGGEGTSNIVMFDENLVTIREINGEPIPDPVEAAKELEAFTGSPAEEAILAADVERALGAKAIAQAEREVLDFRNPLTNETYQVLRNPSPGDVARAIKASSSESLRAVRNKETGDIYAWDADSALHNDTITNLSLPREQMEIVGSIYSAKDYKVRYFRPEVAEPPKPTLDPELAALEVPVDSGFDPFTGEAIPGVRTARDLLDELDADQRTLDEMASCAAPGVKP